MISAFLIAFLVVLLLSMAVIVGEFIYDLWAGNAKVWAVLVAVGFVALGTWIILGVS